MGPPKFLGLTDSHINYSTLFNLMFPQTLYCDPLSDPIPRQSRTVDFQMKKKLREKQMKEHEEGETESPEN